ncbi:MAG: beta-propeller domain-containing protein [Nocardioidaceae bacterium]
MRKSWIVATGIAAAALLAAPVIAHNSGSDSSPRSPLGLPVAAADDELPAFADCDDLLDWYIAKALPEVGPYGFGWGLRAYARNFDGVDAGTALSGPVPSAAAKSPAQDAVGSSDTGTNVQEQGVDEPDFAKTDGNLIVRLQGRRLVITDVSGDRPRELSSTRLPKRVYADQLLLVGDRVLVFGNAPGGVGVRPMADVGRARMAWGGWSNTVLLSYGIGDPAAPELVDRTTYDGSLVEARQYDETVRLVLSNGLPQLDFVTPTKHRTEAEAKRMNKQIVRNSTIDDWLPSALHGGERAPLVDCSDVRHPQQDTGLGTLSIVTFGASDPADDKAVAVTTDSTLAYSSADHLYVAANNDARVKELDDMTGSDGPVDGRPMMRQGSARVYAFDLGADDATYAGSGSVPGWIGDRWSMDEHDGYLRVATHLEGERGGSNRITVLGPAQDGTLRRVGAVGGLGPREQLQSVRWFDDLAVLVTFRQMDPLYTVDLADPAHPRQLGELKIPGFSAYLHPIGGNQLLGLGTSATRRGVSTGGQIATFDIGDLTKPEQIGYLKLDGREDYLTAADNPHAFVYLPQHRTMLTSVQDWNGSHIIEVQVADDGALRETATYVSRYDVRMLPVDGDRVALVGDVVRIVDVT